MSKKYGKIEYISMMKTSMMLLIVFYHCLCFYRGDWFPFVSPVFSANYMVTIAKILNSFMVQVYMTASGYVFYYCTYSLKRKQSAKKRFNRLIIPLILVMFFWVIPIHIVFYGTDAKVILNKFLLFCSPSQLWFLLALFNIFLLGKIIFKYNFFKKNRYAIMLMSYFIGIVCRENNFLYFQIANSLVYLSYYLLGTVLCEKYEMSYKEHIFSIKNIILTIVFLILAYFTDKLYLSLRLYIGIFVVILLFKIFNFIYKKLKFIIHNKFYKHLESNSFGIYLFHQQIIYFSIIVLNGRVHPIPQVLITFLVTLLISDVLVQLLKSNKYLAKIL